jgi:head-tail adaptor
VINAGKLRHSVRIEQRSTIQDGAGEPALSWTLFAARRAAIERTPGREVLASQERQSRVPTTFRLRYLAGVVPAMRLTLWLSPNKRIFNILSAIDPTGLGAELVITAEELIEEAAP